MRRYSKTQVSAIGLMIAGLLASTASAAVISFNMSAADATTSFGSTNWTGGFDPEKTQISGSEKTGVVEVGNWNNSDEATASTISNLIDDTGAATTADVVLPTTEYQQGGGFKSNPPSGTLQELYGAMGGDIFAAGATYTLTLSEIPYAEYDVYAYVGKTDDQGPTQSVAVTLTPSGGSGITYNANNFPNSSTYTAFDDATSDSSGNYVKFSGIDTSSFTLTSDSTAGNANTFAGFQVVQVPEPSTFVLVGLFGFAALIIRRRRG